MTDYTDLRRRLAEEADGADFSSRYAALCAESAAAIAALEAERDALRVKIDRIRAELIARGADSVGDEASAYNDAAIALRVLLECAALTPR